MIKYPSAQQIIQSLSRSFGQESILLEDAYGRVLAENITADRDYPPFNRAAMDGYAIRSADWNEGVRRYKVTETLYAGQAYTQDLSPGFCYKIMTGAAVPPAADAIIRREDSTELNGQAELKAEKIKTFQNIAKRGEDVKKDQLILSAPCLCTPAAISLLASAGKNRILAEKLPQVALFTTGDEIIDIDRPISDLQIRNSNQYLLKSLLRKWNIVPAIVRHLPDDKNLLKSTLQQALSFDMIIMCGGVSAGDTDYVPEVLESLGVKKLFHKVAIKPGKPIWCGQMPSGGMVFALPGNPFSCLVTFTLFIDFFLSTSFGLDIPAGMKLPLNTSRSKRTNLDEFFPVRIAPNHAMLESLAINGSGDIRLGLSADALGIHPSECETVNEGQAIEFIRF